MFDIGFTELMLCFIIALVVLGPEKLPGLARTIGRWTGQARGYLRNLTAELDREAKLSDLKKQLEDANRMVREQSQSMREAVRDTVTRLERDATDTSPPPKPDEPSPPESAEPSAPSEPRRP